MTDSDHPERIRLFVNGTLMAGEELHANLTGARFCGELRTSARYRLFAVGNDHPAMIPTQSDGVPVVGELYEMSLDQLADVLAGEPEGLGVGVVELDDGGKVLGILWLQAQLPASAQDISDIGDWRRYRRAVEERARS